MQIGVTHDGFARSRESVEGTLRPVSQIAALNGGTSSLRSNGINAIVTLDGETGSDAYHVNLIGGRTSSLINVFDTGKPSEGSDSLTINGTDHPDVFLLRSSTGDAGLAFVALQLGFQRGGALATAGVATLFTNALPIAAGTTLFGEGLGSVPPLRAAAFGLTVAGATLLARPAPAEEPAGFVGGAPRVTSD